MGRLKWKFKARGSTMLEPLTAVAIISISLTLAAISFTNVIGSGNDQILGSARLQIQEIVNEIPFSQVISEEMYDLEIVTTPKGEAGLIELEFYVKSKSGDLLEKRTYFRRQ